MCQLLAITRMSLLFPRVLFFHLPCAFIPKPTHLVVWNTLASILIFSTPGPNSAFNVAEILVFLPAPEGP
jgi:hypothetical protein